MKRIITLISTLMVLASYTMKAQDDVTVFKLTDNTIDESIRTSMETNLSELFKSLQIAIIEGNAPVLPKKGITKTAVADVRMLWETSEFICPVLDVEEPLLKTATGNWEVRNIPINLLAADDSNVEQELVIGFDPKGNINSLDISVGKKVYKTIMASNSPIDHARREQIVNFIEVFRTAYNKKDIKYLEQVYSDDALIITGRIVKVKPQSAEQQKQLYGGTERINYIKHTKQTYISNLRQAFANAKFIDVRFSDIEVVKHPKEPNMYGVTLRQDWKTNTYHDDGFVFLLIDFADENKPLIYVRTWQPAMKDGKELTKDEIFSIGSFNVSGS